MRRFVITLWPASRTIRALVVIVAILVAVAILLLTFVDEWSNSEELQRWASIAQSTITSLAIVIGGIFALFKLQAFRDFETHLTIAHNVSHRSIGNSYVHIKVTAELRNSSKVQVEIREASFSLQRISPTTDEEIEARFKETFLERNKESLQWPTLLELKRSWGKSDLTVEPGESHYETIEFLVMSDVESVIIYTYFSNPRFPLSSAIPKGWAASTVYDIEDTSRKVMA